MDSSYLTRGATGRIEWIDAIKGFTMILVVFSHVSLFGFGFGQSPFNSFLIMFRMPLFFFLSGFVAYKAGKIWTGRQFTSDFLKKSRIQLVPMFFFGLLYTLLIRAGQLGLSPLDGISGFFLDDFKYGYWFTLALYEMSVLYYCVSYLSGKFTGREEVPLLVLLALSLVFFCIHKDFEPGAATALSLKRVFEFFLFFVSGLLCRKHFDVFERFARNRYFSALMVLLWFGSYFANVYLPKDGLVFRPLFYITGALCSYSAIFSFFSFFILYPDCSSSSTFVGRTLQKIGRRTLDIYLLHYFFLPDMRTWTGTELIFGGSNIVLEILVVGSLSLAVIGFSLLLSRIIRLSPFLAHWLFGVRY